jgi:hypothetical protein
MPVRLQVDPVDALQPIKSVPHIIPGTSDLGNGKQPDRLNQSTFIYSARRAFLSRTCMAHNSLGQLLLRDLPRFCLSC